MGKKEVNMGTTAVISPSNVDFQNDVFHSISNKAIQNVIRDCQLLTGHNLRIQLHEMLLGHDTKFSHEIKVATEGHIRLLRFGSIVELDESRGINMLLGKMEEARGKQLMLVWSISKIRKFQNIRWVSKQSTPPL
jgi:hypothetical protein